MHSIRKPLAATLTLLALSIAPCKKTEAMVVIGGDWVCYEAYADGQYAGLGGCEYVGDLNGGGSNEPTGGGGAPYGGGGGGSGSTGNSDQIEYDWISLPSPPPIGCQTFPGEEERTNALSALYKEELVLSNGGMPAVMMAEDRANFGKYWLVFFVHPSGAWVGGVYKKAFIYHSTVIFEEIMPPACEI